MIQLNYPDLRLLMSVIESLHSDFDPKTLPQRVLEAAAQLLPSEINSFDFFSSDENYNEIVWSNREDLLTAEILEICAENTFQHPLVPITLENTNSPALKMSDVVTQREFENSEIYNEFFRLIYVKYQMGIPLAITPELTICCVASRADKEFTERDRTMMILLRPHLLHAVRNAHAYQRINSALETRACGIVALDANGKTLFVSEFAHQLLEKYFAKEKLENNSLPETIDRWIKQFDSDVKNGELKSSPQPLKIEIQNAVLTVRLMFNPATGETTLMLEEKSFHPQRLFEHLPVTPREAEVLFWVAQGKTDAEIALICGISARTVQKHIGNIYSKLGVETRTSAMLRAVEIY
jgi:DNA-binding CsgD family transcriptional regulator